MEDWVVTSISKWTGRNSKLQMSLTGPWKPEGAERVTLVFKHDGQEPALFKGMTFHTLRGLDLLNCPEGCVLVWDEEVV
jgi:hypothetical protein